MHQMHKNRFEMTEKEKDREQDYNAMHPIGNLFIRITYPFEAADVVVPSLFLSIIT